MHDYDDAAVTFLGLFAPRLNVQFSDWLAYYDYSIARTFPPQLCEALDARATTSLTVHDHIIIIGLS